MRLMTWNIQFGRGRDGRVDTPRIAREVIAHAPDVVCLQEVVANHPDLASETVGGVSRPVDQPMQLAELLTGWETVFGAASDLPDGRGGRRLFGNLIASRWPIAEVVRHSLPFPADAAAPGMQRGALEATIVCEGRPIRVMTTHLEYFSARRRQAQVAALRALHVEGLNHAMAPRPSLAAPHFAMVARGAEAVLCGDFNCTPDAPEAVALLAPARDVAQTAAPPSLEFHDLWTRVHPGVPHLPTAGLIRDEDFPVPVCFDRILATGALARAARHIHVDSACAASDHQPVIADFRWNDD